MPQDVKRRNNISISNLPGDDELPDYATPVTPSAELKTGLPDYATAVNSDLPDYAEPVKAAEPEKQSMFSKAWEVANKPLVDVTPDMKNAMSAFSKDHPVLGSLGELGTGFLTGSSAPLSLGLEALTGGAIGAKALGLEKVAGMLKAPGIVAGAGMGAHGVFNAGKAAYDMYNDPSWENAGRLASGVVEGGLGALGINHLREAVKPQTKLPITELPKTDLGPEFTPVGDEPVIPSKDNNGRSADDGIYNIARDKFNMGRDSDHVITNGKPTATFKGYQPGVADIPPTALYDIHGGPNDRSTVSAESLKKHGIEIPHTPPYSPDLVPTRPKIHIKSAADKIPSFPHGIHVKGDDYPQFAAHGKGGMKIGADVKSLGKVLGSSLYKGDITKIATKELMQNSLDAVRHLGDKGEVHIELNRGDEPFVEVKDNGKGLTLKEIQSVFSDLGSSGKRDDENAAGGFGLAKAAPLLGGTKVEFTTRVREKGKLYEHTFSGTPDQLLNGVQIKSKELSEGTTGTTVRTYVPEHSSFYDAGNFIDSISAHSPGIKGHIFVDDHYTRYKSSWSDPEPVEWEKHAPVDMEGAQVHHIDAKNANVEIIVPKDAKYAPRQGVKYHIANNGMYQTSGQYGWDQVPGVPDKVIVNIKSKVPEGDSQYPFTANREELRGDVHDQVNKYLENTIVKPAVGKRIDQLKTAYEGMPKVDLPNAQGHRQFFVYDTHNKFTPTELHEILTDPHVRALATHVSDVIHEAMKATENSKWNEKLEKVGFIFDEGLKGIHIPNPGKGKSAVLINPFSIMSDRSPDKAAAGILHVILHELAHVEGGGHDEDFAYRLSQIYEQYGAERSVMAQDKFHEAIARAELDPQKQGYIPEIQKVLSKYNEARGREATGDDALRGTGIGSENKRPDPKRELPINPSTSAKRVTPEQTINKLADALEAAKPQREEQEAMYSAERGKRINKAERIVGPDAEGNIKNPGLKGFHKQLKTLSGELPKVDYEGLRLNESDVDSLIDGITNSQKLLPFEKVRAKIGLLKLISDGEVPQRNELALLSQVYGKPFDRIVEMHGGFGGSVGKKVLLEVANAPKAIMASIDLSAPLRQGLPLIHKTEWWSSLGPMVKSFASQKNFDALQQSLEERPKYLLGKEAGLKLTEIGKDPSHREEAYGSNLANLIPGVKMSERAYVGFLNKLRADTFDSLIDDAKASGLHPNDVMHEIANFVNVATGRGSLGRLDKVATELNTVFFSPRLIASRMTILNPMYYVKASPFVRKEALKSLIAIAAFSTTVNSVAYLMGARNTKIKFSDDKGPGFIPGTHGLPGMPINADTGKAKFGNTRVDPNAGFQQYIVAAGRLLSGETQSSVTNQTSKLGKSFNADTRLGVVSKFFENKLSPAASFVDVLLKGKDFEGKPINVGKEIADRFTPMMINDLVQIYKDDPSHLPLAAAGALGMGLQTYAPTQNQKSAFKLRLR